MLATSKHAQTMLQLVLLLSLSLCDALVNVASGKHYILDPQGFHEVIFRSHNNQGYSHVPVRLEDNGLLTNDVIPVVFPPRLWFNQTAQFNASVIIDLEASITIKEVLLQGPCCNMGIYTPIASYAFGASSFSGPWFYLGESSGLVSGDDAETPAKSFEMHFVIADQSSPWRYIKLDITGEAGRYMGLRLIQLLA